MPMLISKRVKKKHKKPPAIFFWNYISGHKETKCAAVSPKNATAYIRHWIQKNRLDPFGHFYLTIKIHKQPLSTHSVCSDYASLVHPLGKWLDYTLQPIVASQPFYFKDLFSLKQEIDKLVLPPNASIITFDAVAMYTIIDINDSIERIMNFLAEFWDKHDCKAVKEAMEIVMHNNWMRFGDLIFRRICGVAMGMSPAPTIANLYVASSANISCTTRDLLMMGLPFGCTMKILQLMKKIGMTSKPYAMQWA
jgi:hypothetical protein